MHEVALMTETIDLAVARAREEGAVRIRRLLMRVGALSGAVPEALEFAFDVVSRGTMADGATLEIERVPIVCTCANCREEFEAVDLFCVCPRCGRVSTEIRRGRELQLTGLEVE